MKSRSLKQREAPPLPMPENHRELGDEEHLKKGDTIYYFCDPIRSFVILVKSLAGYIGFTPKEMREKYPDIKLRFSTPK